MSAAPSPGRSRTFPRRSRTFRTLAAALALAAASLAAPASAKVLSAQEVLRRAGQKREAMELGSLEAKGTLWANGETARALAAATGTPATNGEVSVEAFVSMKMPGRCRIELSPAAGMARPHLAIGRGKATARELDRVAPVGALLRAACAMLAVKPGGAEPGRAYAEALSRLAIPVTGEGLAKQGQRVSYVIGAPAKERRPQAWFDVQNELPTRLLAALPGPLADVRFLEWGVSPGGETFPRTTEVRESGAAVLRFTITRLAVNTPLPDTLFP